MFYNKYFYSKFLKIFCISALISQDYFFSRFVGNTFWLVAVSYYVYITFLGYASKYSKSAITSIKNSTFLKLFINLGVEILHKTHVILQAAMPVIFFTYIVTLAGGINVSEEVMRFYQERV